MGEIAGIYMSRLLGEGTGFVQMCDWEGCLLVEECGYERIDLEVVGRTVGDWEGSCFLQRVER